MALFAALPAKSHPSELSSTRPAKRRRTSVDSAPSSSTCSDEGASDADDDDLLSPPSSDNDLLTPLSTDSRDLPDKKQFLPSKRPRASSTLVSDEDDTVPILLRATHILRTEAAALAHVSNIYHTSTEAQDCLCAAVRAVLASNANRGKLVICGVGKSAYIAQKLTATCKSLGVRASFMHACEAAHGDLGDVMPEDVVLFITFSGRTPELLNLLPHLPPETQLMAISAASPASACAVLASQPHAILLPAPIPESEKDSFGVTAPTTSTTVAMAVADMLALTLAERIHMRAGVATQDVFERHHPGGAIGLTTAAKVALDEAKLKAERPEIGVLELPSPSLSGSDDR